MNHKTTLFFKSIYIYSRLAFTVKKFNDRSVSVPMYARI